MANRARCYFHLWDLANELRDPEKVDYRPRNDVMAAKSKGELPINCAARNCVWVYPRAVEPRFPGAPVIFETARTYERPDVFSLPKEADVTVEFYGGAIVLWLDGERRRIHVRRFDYVSFPLEEESRHAFMQLWHEVKMLASPAEIELAAQRWLELKQ